jgi:DNA repair protein RecN (Recombination protein N)
MLKRVYIKNFTVFEEAEWHPGNGMISITGETGAGKSVLVDALLLATGDRAMGRLLWDENEKGIIEIEFHISEWKNIPLPDPVEHWNGTFLFRRELYPDGRSRLFLNDTPVQLSDARKTAEFLVKIHSQHATADLKKKEFVYEFLDRSANIYEYYINEYLASFLDWKKAVSEYEKALNNKEETERERGFLEFQWKELSVLNEKEEKYYLDLEKKVERFEKKQKLFEELQSALYFIENGENNATSFLIQAQKHLQLAGKMLSDAKIAEINDRLHKSINDLRELSAELEKIITEDDVSETEIQKILADYDLVSRLLFRFKKKNASDLLKLKNEIRDKLALLNAGEESVQELFELKEKYFERCVEKGIKLSEIRAGKKAEIENRVKEGLSMLCMPDAFFEIRISKKNEPGSLGLDDIQIYFSANKGIQPDSLDRAASGGELSRIMLVLKKCMNVEDASTLVLDEIDSGISGQAALQVGKFVRNMAEGKQILCITHLPQVASRSHRHYKILKEIGSDGKTRSRIIDLDKESRVKEIATMLSHTNPGENALKAAQDLMSEAI